jgi:hypothetical protein
MFPLGDILPLGNMMINRIADLRRIGGIRHRFDTEQPTLLDLEVINRALGKIESENFLLDSSENVISLVW